MASYDDDNSSGDGKSKNNRNNKNNNNNEQSFIMNDASSDIDNESIEYRSDYDDDDDEDMEEIDNDDDNNDEYDDDNNDNNNSNDDDYDSDKEKRKSSKNSSLNNNRKKSSSKTSSNNKNNHKKSPARDPKPRSKKIDLAKTRYLWVSGVPVGTKSQHLEEIFSKYAKVLAIKIIRGGNNSLLGFVKLESHDQAQRCLDKLNKTEFRGNKIELFKERPVEKDDDGKKLEKIGFTDSRKYLIKSIPNKRPRHYHSTFRPSRGSYHHRPLSSKISRGPPIRLSSSSSSANRSSHHQIRSSNNERDESTRLDRERQKLKLERLRFEQEKAEYYKVERKTSKFDYDRNADDGNNGGRSPEDKTTSPPHRIRSMVKRGSVGRTFEEGAPFVHHETKRYDDYERRDFNTNRRYDSRSSPPDRKVNPRSSFGTTISGGNRGSYESGSRPDHRYPDLTNKNWQQSMNSWMNTGLNTSVGADNRAWNSSGFDHTSRLLSGNIGATSSSGSISSARISHSDIQSRGHSGGYYNNRRY